MFRAIDPASLGMEAGGMEAGGMEAGGVEAGGMEACQTQPSLMGIKSNHNIYKAPFQHSLLMAPYIIKKTGESLNVFFKQFMAPYKMFKKTGKS